jgi:hypothetical protein
MTGWRGSEIDWEKTQKRKPIERLPTKKANNASVPPLSG